MSLSLKIDGVEYAATRIRARANGEQGISGLSSAADGTGSQAAFVIDDPFAEVELREWMSVVAEETECVDAPRLFTGYVASFVERRGKYRSGQRREIDVTAVDQNALLSLRNLTGGDTKRDRETDTQRLNWLIHSDYLDGIVFDTGYINGADRWFDAEDLHGKFPSEVIGDLCGPRGQSFFAFYDQEARQVSLFYDAPTATTLTSVLSVSNVLDDCGPTNDPDTTCFFPYVDAERNSSGEDLADNIRYVYKGGVVYRTNPTTQATYFGEPLRHRGINAQNDLVGLRTTAITFADRILASRSSPIVTVSFTLRLPAAKVGLIDAGYRLPVKFTHLTGFTSFTYTRVETKTLVQTEGRRDYYDVQLTCSLNGYRGSTTGGGGVPGTNPFPTQQPSGPCGDGTVQLTIPSNTNQSVQTFSITTGQYLYVLSIHYDVTWLGTSTWALWLANDAGPPVSGVDPLVLDTHQQAVGVQSVGTWNSPAYDPPAEMFAIERSTGQTDYAVFWPGDDDEGPLGWFTGLNGTYHLGAGNNLDGYFSAVGYSCSICVLVSDVAPDDFLAPATPEESTPPSGSPNGTGEIVVMDGNQGTTAHPYAPNSLHVFVDNTDQTAAVTETDPTCGTFTLAFTPTPTEVVKVYYVVA